MVPVEQPNLLSQFQVEHEIGSGSFGIVLKAQRSKMVPGLPASVAIKVEGGTCPEPMLRKEYAIYSRLQKITSKSPTVEGYVEVEGEGSFLVMELLGSNLEERLRERSSEVGEILHWAVVMLERLKTLHSQGFIHRDVKPNNYVFGCTGTPRSNDIFLIDYGLATRYLDSQDKHRPLKKHVPFVGTTRYCSNNALKKLRQSRRDDVESWVYSVIYLINRKLPWSNIVCKNNRQKRYQILQLRESVGDDLFRGVPEALKEIYRHVLSLDYQDEPGYELYKKWLQRSMGYTVENQAPTLVSNTLPVFSESENSEALAARKQAFENRNTPSDLGTWLQSAQSLDFKMDVSGQAHVSKHPKISKIVATFKGLFKRRAPRGRRPSVSTHIEYVPTGAPDQGEEQDHVHFSTDEADSQSHAADLLH